MDRTENEVEAVSGTTHTIATSTSKVSNPDKKNILSKKSQSPQCRWRTPIIRAGGSETPSVVQIPEEGWYAFCFGCSGLDNEKVEDPSPGRPAVEALLCIELGLDNMVDCACANNEIQTTATVVRIELPLSSEKGWLRNVNVGKQIFLTRGAKLTVASTNQGQRKCQSECLQQWCVIFHHSLMLKHEHNGMTTTRSASTLSSSISKKQLTPPSVLAAGETERPSVGTLSNHKTSLVCQHCVRSFPSQHAALNHVDSIHRSTNLIINNKTTTTNTIARAKKRQKNGDCSIDRVDFDENIDDSDDKDIWTRPLSLLFEDDFMAVIDKPQGMAVMGTKPCLLRCDLLMSLRCQQHKSKSNNDDDKNRLPEGDEALKKPRPVHRLDAATGGVLVVAKTRRTETVLKACFEQRQCHKRYRAIVLGKLQASPSDVSSRVSDDRGVIDLPISGKPSQTLYRPIRYVQSVRAQGWLTLVDLWPVTGRRHQLRKHMKELGHPILGDRRHGGASQNRKMVEQEPSTVTAVTSRRLSLWAMEITLPHPTTGEERTFGLTQDPTWLEQVLQLEEDAWKQRHEPRSSDANLSSKEQNNQM